MQTKVRKIWKVGLVVQVILGVGLGVFESTGGAYFYDSFKQVFHPSTAILLATSLLALRYGLIAILEVPSGVLADVIGRAHVTVLSFALRTGFFIALGGLALAKNKISMLVLGVFISILWAVSYTLFTGSFTAWCVDRLAEDSPDTSCAWLISRLQSQFLAATAVGTAIGIVFYVNAAPSMAYLFMALFSFVAMGFCIMWMKEPKFLKFVSADQRHVKNIIKQAMITLRRGVKICYQRPILLWLSVTFGCYMALLNLVMFLWPVYFKEHMRLEKFGPVWITLALMMVSLRALSARTLVHLNNSWEKGNKGTTNVRGFRNIQMAAAIIAVISIYVLGWAVAEEKNVLWVMAAAVSVVCIGYGFVVTSYETLINAYIPRAYSQERATITSAGSMFRSLIAMLIAVPAGGTNIENSPSFWAVPATLLLFSVIGMYFAVRKEDSASASIEGESVVTENVG